MENNNPERRQLEDIKKRIDNVRVLVIKLSVLFVLFILTVIFLVEYRVESFAIYVILISLGSYIIGKYNGFYDGAYYGMENHEIVNKYFEAKKKDVYDK